MRKIEVPWLKSDVGAGDAFKNLTDLVLGPSKTYCQAYDRRRTVLNGLLTFAAPSAQPPQRPQQVPIDRRPSDWMQMYNTVDDEQLPDGS